MSFSHLAIKENLEEVVLSLKVGSVPIIDTTMEASEFEGPTPAIANSLWYPLLVELESGMHQIVIQGIRGFTNDTTDTSGLGIDDLEINYCQEFGKSKLIISDTARI